MPAQGSRAPWRLAALSIATLVSVVPATALASVAPGAAVGTAHVTSPAATSGLVTRDGTRLLLDGQPFRFTGFDVYNANSDGWCGAPLGSGPELDRALNAWGSRMEVMRSWFFQPLAINKGTNQRDWSAFDHTLATASAHGIKVIATLTDQWGECGSNASNPAKTADWYVDGYKQVQLGMIDSYRDYVSEVVTRYRGDPRIAFWQLINEAEVSPCAPGDTTPHDTLKAWATDVSGLVKSIDPDHLVSLGTIGSGQCGAQSTEYQDLHDIATIDLCEFHDYGAADVPIPGDQWNGLAARIDECNALDKPIFVGEAGIKPNDFGVDGTFQGRADAFAAKLQGQFAAGVQGFLAWAWSPNLPPTSDPTGYDIGPGDPAIDALRGPSLAVATPEHSELVSLRSDGTPWPYAMVNPADRGNRVVSADGDRIALTVADSFGDYDKVIVRDRATSQTFIVDQQHALGATISRDGRYVGYEGGLSDRQAWLAEVDTGTRWLASHTSDGNRGNGTSTGASIGADGRYVVFHSSSSDLLSVDTDHTYDVYRYDRLSDDLLLVSVSSTGVKGNSDSVFASISDDGRYVAFRSWATNLVPGDTNNAEDLFVRDLQVGTTTRVSIATDGSQALGRTHSGFIGGGHVVVFASDATNLAPGTPPDQLNLFMHDMVSGVTSRVGPGNRNFPSISSDGRYLIVGGSPEGYVYDLWQDSTRTFPYGDRGVGVGYDGRFVVVGSGDQATLFDLDAVPDVDPPVADTIAITPDPVGLGDRPQVTATGHDIGYGLASAELFADVDPGEGQGQTVSVIGLNPGRIDVGLDPLPAGDHVVSVRFEDTSGLWSAPISTTLTVSPSGGRESASRTDFPFVTTDPDQSGPTTDDPVETTLAGQGSGSASIDELPLTGSAPPGVVRIGQEIHLTTDAGTVNAPIQAHVTLDASLFPNGMGIGNVILRLDGAVVPACSTSFQPRANPDPCVPYRFPVADGDGRIHLWTSHVGVVTTEVPATVVTAPSAPVGVVAAAGSGQASVSWQPPASDGGSPLTGYVVTASSGQVASVGASTTTTTVTGLANGAPVTFTVRASNSVGPGSPSSPSAAVTPQAGSQGSSATVPPSGGTLSTDAGGGPTAADPTTTSVTVPATAGGGAITISEGSASGSPPGGYSFLGQRIEIVSTATTSATDPLTIVFTIDESAVRQALGLGPADPLPDPAAVDITRSEGGGAPAVIDDCTSVGGGGAPIAPAPTCVSARAYVNGGTDLRLTVLTAAASTWVAAVHPTRVTVGDRAVSPVTATLAQGGTVVWTFTGTKKHSVTECGTLGAGKKPLFDSGPLQSGQYGHGFDAAGTYAYTSTIKGDPASLAGSIAVPMIASPAIGSRTSSFSIRWSARALPGYVFDVQVRYQKPGSSKWSGWAPWRTGDAAASRPFVPTSGAGTYQFQARLRNEASGKASGWSPVASITAQ
jgi:Tol biopolymer transport system component/plastocyanin